MGRVTGRWPSCHRDETAQAYEGTAALPLPRSLPPGTFLKLGRLRRLRLVHTWSPSSFNTVLYLFSRHRDQARFLHP